MQVDVLHRDDLRVAAARRAPLDAEHGAERRFPQGQHGAFPDSFHGLGQADGDGGLALARRGGVDGRHENQPAVFSAGEPFPQALLQLGLVPAVKLQFVFTDAQLRRNLRDGPQLCLLRDLNIRKHLLCSPSFF